MRKLFIYLFIFAVSGCSFIDGKCQLQSEAEIKAHNTAKILKSISNEPPENWDLLINERLRVLETAETYLLSTDSDLSALCLHSIELVPGSQWLMKEHWMITWDQQGIFDIEQVFVQLDKNGGVQMIGSKKPENASYLSINKFIKWFGS